MLIGYARVSTEKQNLDMQIQLSKRQDVLESSLKKLEAQMCNVLSMSN